MCREEGGEKLVGFLLSKALPHMSFTRSRPRLLEPRSYKNHSLDFNPPHILCIYPGLCHLRTHSCRPQTICSRPVTLLAPLLNQETLPLKKKKKASSTEGYSSVLPIIEARVSTSSAAFYLASNTMPRPLDLEAWDSGHAPSGARRIKGQIPRLAPPKL